jgi:hypothetical protein
MIFAWACSKREDRLNKTSQDRRRIFAAWVCLLTALLLYGPLAAAAWSSHVMACCTNNHCDIPRHHHNKPQELPASDAAGAMDCAHDMSGMTACSMSCCQDPDRPVVTAVVFVLPHPAFALGAMPVTRANDARRSIEIPRAIEPLSPPPRLAAAAL